MIKTRKVDKDKTIVKTSSTVRKIDLTSRDFCFHLGPFMPFNSGGFDTHIETSSHLIKSNSTIETSASKKK